MRALIVVVTSTMLAACGGSGGPGETPGTPDSAPLVAATAAAHENDAPDPSPAAEVEPSVPVIAQEFAYGATDKSNLIGYLAMPEDVIEPLPGVIVIHEWWGLNDNIKAMTRRLAGEGYVVLAVDLYGRATAEDPDAAQALMAGVLAAPEAALSNIRQARGYLSDYALAPRIAMLGWCLGGGWSLRAGLELGADVDAVVMYYGQVVTDEALLDRLEAPLLGLFAARDAAIPVSDVQAFRTALDSLGKRAEVFVYPDVDHAFANPSGGAYDAESAADAWARTLAFLEANL